MHYTRAQQLYMDFAERVAEESCANRLKVGCVLVNPCTNSIISYGYNGTPAGYKTNVCEDENNQTLPIVTHAEINALAKAGKSGISTLGCQLYLTHSPCQNCASAIKAFGITNVYYRQDYRDSTGVDQLRELGVWVEKLALD